LTGGVPGNSLLRRIAKVLSVKFGVRLKPLFRGAILVFLKVGDKVIEDIRKIVFEPIVTDETFRPNEETRAPLRGEGDSDGSVDKPCGKESVQFMKGVLEFRPCMEELGLAAIEGLNNAFDIFLNVSITESLIAVQFWKLIDVEGTICDVLHRSLGHPMPTRENVLRELQGL